MSKKFQLSYLETGLKICSNCNVEKPICDFYKRNEGNNQRIRSKCKDCIYVIKTKGKDNFEENKKNYNQRKMKQTSEYRRLVTFSSENPKRGSYYEVSSRDTMLRTKYGITINQYNNMVIEQEQKCYICKVETDYNLCVDHCHETGKVRKLLCNSCNLSLGRVKENKETLKNMIKYLDEHPKTCGVCSEPCNNDWCITNKDKK